MVNLLLHKYALSSNYHTLIELLVGNKDNLIALMSNVDGNLRLHNLCVDKIELSYIADKILYQNEYLCLTASLPILVK